MKGKIKKYSVALGELTEEALMHDLEHLELIRNKKGMMGKVILSIFAVIYSGYYHFIFARMKKEKLLSARVVRMLENKGVKKMKPRFDTEIWIWLVVIALMICFAVEETITAEKIPQGKIIPCYDGDGSKIINATCEETRNCGYFSKMIFKVCKAVENE